MADTIVGITKTRLTSLVKSAYEAGWHGSLDLANESSTEIVEECIASIIAETAKQPHEALGKAIPAAPVPSYSETNITNNEYFDSEFGSDVLTDVPTDLPTDDGVNNLFDFVGTQNQKTVADSSSFAGSGYYKNLSNAQNPVKYIHRSPGGAPRVDLAVEKHVKNTYPRRADCPQYDSIDNAVKKKKSRGRRRGSRAMEYDSSNLPKAVFGANLGDQFKETGDL